MAGSADYLRCALVKVSLIDVTLYQPGGKKTTAPDPTPGRTLEGIQLVPLLRGQYSARDCLPLRSVYPRHKRTAPIAMMLAPSLIPSHRSARALGVSAETVGVGMDRECFHALTWAVRRGPGRDTLKGSP